MALHSSPVTFFSIADQFLTPFLVSINGFYTTADRFAGSATCAVSHWFTSRHMGYAALHRIYHLLLDSSAWFISSATVHSRALVRRFSPFSRHAAVLLVHAPARSYHSYGRCVFSSVSTLLTLSHLFCLQIRTAAVPVAGTCHLRYTPAVLHGSATCAALYCLQPRCIPFFSSQRFLFLPARATDRSFLRVLNFRTMDLRFALRSIQQLLADNTYRSICCGFIC